MANKIELPQDVDLAAKVIETEGQKEHRKQEMGWLGRVFGSVEDKPGNITGFVIILLIAAICALAFLGPGDPNFPVDKVLTAFLSILTIALGYLFGRSGG